MRRLVYAFVAAPFVVAGLTLVGHLTPTAAQESKPADPVVPGSYEGSKKCKKCHLKEFKAWEETPHAKALEVLAPNAKADVKKGLGLDPAKDYRTDPSCVKCHVVGLGQKGGFDPAKHIEKDRDLLAGVGCETCHGPAAELVGTGLKDGDYGANHDARLPELVKKGYVPKPDAESCKRCHNDSSPTFKGKTFDFEEMKKKGVHTTAK